MKVILIAVGDDRPGLTQSLADAIVTAGGNWLDSHFARLGGKYVGSVLVDLPEDGLETLEKAATGTEALGFQVTIVPSAGEADAAGRRLTFDLVGKDRPGIVQEVTTSLARLGVNIDDLETRTEASAMSGGMLFRARARLILPDGASLEEVQDVLEGISGEIMVDFETE